MTKLTFEIDVPEGRDKAVWVAGYISSTLHLIMKQPVDADWKVTENERR